jgi:hypothetical protein
MILNIDKNRTYGLSQEEIDCIIEKYFDGETTDKEEKLLLRFLATPQAEDKRYNEIKAVMGFVAVGKKIYEKKIEKSSKKILSIRPYRWIAAAVIGCIIGTAGWRIVDNQQNVCVAYIGGEKCTDPQLVMSHVRQSLHSIDYEECKGTVDNQLNDIFSTISNDNDYDKNE